MRKLKWVVCLSLLFVFPAAVALAAYHHEGENDAGRFLEAYPDKAGTKLDNCNLCHRGGSYVNYKDQEVQLGSCQWCHQSYGYDGAGEIEETMNAFGVAYKANGRNAQAVAAIDTVDSDDDGYTNAEEIAANALPGDASDYPGLVQAPYRVYTRAQLESLCRHIRSSC
jgi:hypothetical protein